MNVKSLKFSGYKSFPGGDNEPAGSLQTFELAPLTLIFGKNNSGKSAVARLPRLLLGGLACNDPRILPLEVRGMKYGERFGHLIHGGDFFGRPTFEVCAEHEEDTLDISATLFMHSAFTEDDPPSLWSYDMRAPDRIQWNATEASTAPFELAGLLPKEPRWDSWRQAASSLLDHMVHLGPVRAPIQPAYGEAQPSKLGFDGGESAQWLRADPQLADSVGDWFAEHLDGWRLSVSRSNDSFSLHIRRGGAMRSNLARAGSGLQQVLPVVLHQLWRQQQADTEAMTPFLDVVEQPELHLHDAAQAPLVDLFIDTARQGIGHTIVETHSEPILLRLQRRIAETKIAPDEVALYFVNADDEGSQLRRIHLNIDGEVDWWPEGVFEEDFHEVAAMRRAQRDAKRPGSSAA